MTESKLIIPLKVWTADEIKNKLLTDDRWLERAILAIYSKQTSYEQSAETTKDLNKVGFSGPDAAFGTSLAKQIQKGWHLSPKQKVIAKRMMPKYSAQLAKIANKMINPKGYGLGNVHFLPCPKCSQLNPVTKANVYIKCSKCGRNLVSVKVRRK